MEGAGCGEGLAAIGESVGQRPRQPRRIPGGGPGKGCVVGVAYESKWTEHLTGGGVVGRRQKPSRKGDRRLLGQIPLPVEFDPPDVVLGANAGPLVGVKLQPEHGGREQFALVTGRVVFAVQEPVEGMPELLERQPDDALVRDACVDPLFAHQNQRLVGRTGADERRECPAKDREVHEPDRDLDLPCGERIAKLLAPRAIECRPRGAAGEPLRKAIDRIGEPEPCRSPPRGLVEPPFEPVDDRGIGLRSPLEAEGASWTRDELWRLSYRRLRLPKEHRSQR